MTNEENPIHQAWLKGYSAYSPEDGAEDLEQKISKGNP